MAAIIGKAWQGYKFLFEDMTDPRTRSWFLLAKPYQGLTLLALYLMFVLKWGPEWMKNRPAFNLKKTMIVYNALQVVACFYLFCAGIWYGWGWDYQWFCEPVDFSDNVNAINIAKLVHFYFILKVVDLLDTIFFVLRKKFNQVTFLHVYHHTGMVMLIWGAGTYFPGGHGSLIGVINSFVHTVMYSYYLVTVYMPSVKESSWKKYITQLQIIQFLWTVIHMGVVVFKPDCAYPRWTAAVFLPQNLFMLILFIDFYIKSYIRKPQAVKEKDATKNNEKNGTKKMNGEAKIVRNGLYGENGEGNGDSRQLKESLVSRASLDHRLKNGTKENGKDKTN